MKQNSRQQDAASRRVTATAIVLILLLAVVLISGLYAVYSSIQRSTAERKAVQQISSERLASNKALDLPADYPSDILPVWEGSDIKEQERREVQSIDGHPMDQWKVHAETDDDKQAVFEFYNKLLLEQGMAQTLFASVPSGYGVTYADEQSEIQLTIEKKLSDERTQIEITFSRLRE